MKNIVYYIPPRVVLILMIALGLTSCQKEFLDKNLINRCWYRPR